MHNVSSLIQMIRTALVCVCVRERERENSRI